MLELTIPARESFNEETNCFEKLEKDAVLKLEHSLISISKWESKYKKSFLHSDKNRDEVVDYVKFMTLNSKEVDEKVYERLTSENLDTIIKYIDDPMSATWFSDNNKPGPPGKKEIITSEIIYYWMISMNIPVEFEKWHLNRLLTLIKVCSIKNAPDKKMSRKETMDRHKSLNAMRRAQSKKK